MTFEDSLAGGVLQAAGGAGRIDSCTNCGLPLPLLLPQPKKPAASWACAGCTAQYEGILDVLAPAELFANIRPIRTHDIDLEPDNAPPIPDEWIRRFLLKQSHYLGTERRCAPRYPVFLPFVGIPVDATLGQAGDTIRGTTRNLSTSGIALLSLRCVQKGLLFVQLQPPASDPIDLLMRIVACTNLKRVYEIRGPLLMRLRG